MIRAVLDVNVVLSAIIAPQGTPRRILDAWQARLFSCLTSEGIIDEVTAKLRQPRIGRAYGITEEDIAWVAALLRTQAENVTIPLSAVVLVTGDPEDDYVLATEATFRADYLVTGDKKLQELGGYQGVRIVSPREFLELL